MDSILDIVHFLSSRICNGRRAGTEGSVTARKYIIDQLKSAGAIPPPGFSSYTQDLQENTDTYGKNILGVLPGSGAAADEYILLEAHYDHLGEDRESGHYFPGANDNAAAVAVILHAVQYFLVSRNDEGPRRSVLLGFFDAEEPPFFSSPLMGAHQFCEAAPDLYKSVKAGVFLDLLGHPSIPCRVLSKGVFAAGAEKWGAAEFVDRETENCELRLHRIGIHTVPPSGNYLAFKERNKPYIFLTSGRAEYYHSIEDSAEKLDYPKLNAISRRLSLLLQDLTTANDSVFEFNEKGQDDRATVMTLKRIAACLASDHTDISDISELLNEQQKTVQTKKTLNDFERSKLSYILGVFEKKIRP